MRNDKIRPAVCSRRRWRGIVGTVEKRPTGFLPNRKEPAFPDWCPEHADISEITQREDGSLVHSEISLTGACGCGPEHGVRIGSRDQKFPGIHAQDWML